MINKNIVCPRFSWKSLHAFENTRNHRKVVVIELVSNLPLTLENDLRKNENVNHKVVTTEAIQNNEAAS